MFCSLAIKIQFAISTDSTHNPWPVWLLFNLNKLTMSIGLPGKSCIRNRTSRNLLARFQLYWVEWPGTAEGWACSVAVPMTLNSFLCCSCFTTTRNERKNISRFVELPNAENCYANRLPLVLMILSGKWRKKKFLNYLVASMKESEIMHERAALKTTLTARVVQHCSLYDF